MKHHSHPKGINLENLIRMADYIETVPQEKFDMSEFRNDYWNTKYMVEPKCNSVGCIIGHCTILDDKDLPRNWSEDIDFAEWSQKFIGTDDDSVWEYLFDANWRDTDNTPTGAAKRIRYYVANGLPENWQEQLWGEAPLSYL
jgi:hypothetical protein